MKKSNLQKIKSIESLNNSRIYLIKKFQETKNYKYYFKANEYVKEIFRRDPKFIIQ